MYHARKRFHSSRKINPNKGAQSMLSKALYIRLFAVWLIMNPFGSIFALSLIGTVAMGTRILIHDHPQIRSGIPSSGDREMGAIEQHLDSIDARIKVLDTETDKKITELNQDRAEKRTESTARWTTLADTLKEINLRFEAEEADQRLYRERVIGDEKIVFGIVGCITFFGGASFLKKYFGARQAVNLVQVDETQLEAVVQPRKRSVPRAPNSSRSSSSTPRKRKSSPRT